MRLSCPTCDAVYEVPQGAIPDGGRDVQCSNCGTVWFQRSGEPPAPPSAAALASTASPARRAGGGEDAPRPPLSDEGRRILVEEAERERALRAGGNAAPDEPRGAAAAIDSLLDEDRGYTPQPRRLPDDESAASRPSPSMREPALRSGNVSGAEPTSGPPSDRPSGRDRFPAIAEIDSKLEPQDAGNASRDDASSAEKDGGSGFRLGFALALLIAALALALYMQADRIGQAIPSLDAPLDAYRDRVNDMRIALDGLARSAAEALEE